MSAVVHIKAGLMECFWKLIFSVKATKFEKNVVKHSIFFAPAISPIISMRVMWSESAGEMWNRHTKVPKIVSGLLFPVSDKNYSNKMINFTFFCVNKIHWF